MKNTYSEIRKITKRTVNLLFLTLILFVNNLNAQEVSFETSEPFYPWVETIGELENEWGYMLVPENWENPAGNTIKVAVTILKNWSNIENAEAVVFVQGGPGASGIENIGSWIYHPLREKNDIVLMDLRGTGFSEPRLCPDLGQKFLNILAKNQSNQDDVKQKVAETLICRQDLVNKGVDIDSYHSLSVANDLHALKNELGYAQWSVYGVSYGTYMAQVYASNFPDDLRSLVLDSAIDDISSYYTKNTSNYLDSLFKVFEACSNDPECNQQYPDLEKVYFETIADLNKNPLTVAVKKDLVESGTFTYNAEDFKVALQQALYKKKIIEVIPLVVYQFHNRNEKALGNLVSAFSGLLSMDYGVYYCVSCNETLPNNKFEEFEQNAQQFEAKGLMGGVSFYKSDFKVCDQWNLNKPDSLSIYNKVDLSELTIPTLIFEGEYDPITPPANGDRIAKGLTSVQVIKAPTYGHAPSFTEMGKEAASAFVNSSEETTLVTEFDQYSKVDFITGIALNSGISRMGESLNSPNPLFLAPLGIALLLMISFTFTYFVKLISKKYSTLSDKVVRALSVVMSIVGITGIVGLILALFNISGRNYFILAFGLPENFNYLFTLSMVFMVLVLLTFVYFITRLRKINDRSIVFSFIFSNMLLATYLLYWGIV